MIGYETALTECPEFGILFDVDGVLARGSTPLDSAIKAIEKLTDENGNLNVPCAFVTNACSRPHDKARQIEKWFGLKVTPDQVIHAPTPAQLLRDLHHKFTLVIGQEHRLDIAVELGFQDVCTIEDIKSAYPLLDMVDHENRIKVARGYKENQDFPSVEAILLIGEPTHWETNLQLIIDLLLTGGKPTTAPHNERFVQHIPVIACSMDLVFMADACMPRFGHGAFLVCLEALYRKITGREIIYTSLVGKPCEITYRFAEHVITNVAKRMRINRPIKRLYFIGDNPNVDIVGANLYDRYVKKLLPCTNHDSRNNNSVSLVSREPLDLPLSREIPLGLDLHGQTVEECFSLLVGTGVYEHGTEIIETGTDDQPAIYHGHRDIAYEPHLTIPHKYVHDVNEGIQYIFNREAIFTHCHLNNV